MAELPGHRLGQIIGDALEGSLRPMLQEFADQYHLYLDTHGTPRVIALVYARVRNSGGRGFGSQV